MTIEQKWWSSLSVSDRIFYIMQWREKEKNTEDIIKLYLFPEIPEKIYKFIKTKNEKVIS